MERVISGCIAVGIHVVLVVSVNIVTGYARQLSLGQAAFAGLGAYTSAVLTVHWGWSFWLACPTSFGVAGVVGLILGLPVLRAERFYLPVMTLGVAFLVPRLLRTGRLVGNTIGWGRIEPPHLFGHLMSPEWYLALVGVVLAGCVMLDRWFWHSRSGQVLRQEAEVPSRPVRRAMVVAFGLSTALAGLAGSLFAHFEAFISPFDFEWEASLFVLALAAGGGLGSLPSVLVSAVLLGGVFEFYPPLLHYRLLVSGAILLLVGLWFPCGLRAVPTLIRRKARVVSPVQTVEVFSTNQPCRR